RGVQEEAQASIQYGADLYVSGLRMGQKAPLPLEAMQQIKRDIDDVEEVVPRIVGGVVLEGQPAVLVGMPENRFPAVIHCVRGRLPQSREPYELVLGADLAQRLAYEVGSPVRYFHPTVRPARLSTVVGVFRSDVSLWQARLIFTTLQTAQKIF